MEIRESLKVQLGLNSTSHKSTFSPFLGYLAAMATGHPLEKCVDVGNFAARTIIQQSGCTFPDKCEYGSK
jgi:hypothetical protein